MTLIWRIYVALAALLLLALVVLRLAAAQLVVATNLGFILAFGFSAAFFGALADLRGLDYSSTSPGLPLITFSSLFLALALDGLLGLNYWLPEASWRSLLASSPLLLFASGGWWVVCTRTAAEVRRLTPVLWLGLLLAFGGAAAILAALQAST